MDSKSGEVFVCSLYDTVAREHGPLFYARNMGLLQRAVRGFLEAQAGVRKSEFVVRVHGSMDVFEAMPVLDVTVAENFDCDLQSLGGGE